MSITIPAIQNRFAGIDVPKTSTMFVGKMFGICFAAEPNHSSIVAWRVSRIPSEATSLASGDDVRSGRKTSSSLSTPTSNDTSDVTTNAGAVASVKPKKSDLQRPERVGRHHRDRAGGEVDDARAAVRDDDAHGDPGDHCTGPEAEQDEEHEILHRAAQPRGGSSIGKAGARSVRRDPTFRRRHPVAGFAPDLPAPLYW